MSDAKRATKMAMRKARGDTKLAANRLTKLKELKTQMKEVKYDLADESHLRENLEKMGIFRQEIKKGRLIGRCGGQSHWPLHICMLVCELLCNGVPPDCVREKLKTTSEYFTGSVVTKLPSVSYVRECCTFLQILNDLLGAYKLGMSATWKQLCIDRTTRRLIGFQSLVIGLLTKKVFDLVIASACIFMDDKTSEMQVKGIENKVL